jgi:hypothetical protein
LVSSPARVQPASAWVQDVGEPSATIGSSSADVVAMPSSSAILRSGLVAVLAAPLALAGCDARAGDHAAATSSPRSPTATSAPSTDRRTYDGQGCAASEDRVDLAAPTFSNPTQITNPLFPISQLRSAVLVGHVDGQPFRTETTLLPGSETVIWNSRPVQALVSQYVAYLAGRVQKVALDRYAQADDGSVWYFGEDGFDYEDGAISSAPPATDPP